MQKKKKKEFQIIFLFFLYSSKANVFTAFLYIINIALSSIPSDSITFSVCCRLLRWFMSKLKCVLNVHPVVGNIDSTDTNLILYQHS